MKQKYDTLGDTIVGQVSTLIQDDPGRKSDKDIQMAMDAIKSGTWLTSSEQAETALEVLMNVVKEKKAEARKKLTPEGKLKPGDVDDGWEYLGGDPNMATSWRRVQ